MTAPSALPNFPPPADEHPLRGRVLDALIDLGAQPDIDKDGDVAFSVNDQQLFVRTSEGELKVMRLFGQWQLPEELAGDQLKVLETCNELNLALNCVKTGVGNGTLVVTTEHMESPGLDVKMTVQVGIQLVLQAVHVWHQRALGLEPDADGDASSNGSGEEGRS